MQYSLVTTNVTTKWQESSTGTQIREFLRFQLRISEDGYEAFLHDYVDRVE